MQYSKSASICSSAMSKACSVCFSWRSAHIKQIPVPDSLQCWQSAVPLQRTYDAKLSLQHYKQLFIQLRQQPACCRRWAQHAVAASTEHATDISAGDVTAEEVSAGAVSAEEVDAESAKLLEWPAVCAQVVAFTSTPAAAERVLSSGLPLGASLVRYYCCLASKPASCALYTGTLTFLPCCRHYRHLCKPLLTTLHQIAQSKF